jgi:tRNA(fMet)-specific endonuclease VapC
VSLLYLLDTNIVSAALRGSAPVDQRLQTASAWAISAVTESELRFGIEKRPEATRLRRLVQGFLQMAAVHAWDSAAAAEHARVRAHLQNLGRPIGDFDEMIAAHALSLGAILVTDNMRHFQRVPGLALENWLRPT